MADKNKNKQVAPVKTEEDENFKRSEEDKESVREGSGIFTYESKLSPNYVQFTIDYRAKWAWWNLFGMVANAGIGALTVGIIQSHPNECAGIKLASWAMFTLYCLTFLFQAMCLCGLEKRCCTNMGMLAVLIYDMIVLTWSQVTYF
jgi:hypothetical protein